MTALAERNISCLCKVSYFDVNKGFGFLEPVVSIDILDSAFIEEMRKGIFFE